MSRLLAYLANDRKALTAALRPLREQLRGRPPAEGAPAEGFGIGYYDDGNPLLKKYPSVDPRRIDFFEASRELPSDCVVMHRRRPTVGSLSPENTQPFRFRRWLFAHHGDVPGLDRVRPRLLAEIPTHLQRTLDGQTDSEVIFMMLMTFIHHEGRLDDANIDAQTLSEYLRATIWRVRSLQKELGNGVEPPVLDMVITNGRVMAATHVGRTLHYCLREGVVGGEPEEMERLSHLRAVFLSYGHEPELAKGWIAVPEGAAVTVERGLDVQVVAL